MGDFLASLLNIYTSEIFAYWDVQQQTSWVIAPGPGGLVSPSGRFASLFCDQGLDFASKKLCQTS